MYRMNWHTTHDTRAMFGEHKSQDDAFGKGLFDLPSCFKYFPTTSSKVAHSDTRPAVCRTKKEV